MATIDESLLIEADEDLLHSRRQARVHREALALPVAGRADGAKLLDDDAAVFLLPFCGFLPRILLKLTGKLLAFQNSRGHVG